MGSYWSKLLIQQYWNLFCLGLWKSSFLTAQMWICRMEVARTGRCGTCPKWSPCLCYSAYSQRAFDLAPIFSCFFWHYWGMIGCQRNDGDSKAGLFICYCYIQRGNSGDIYYNASSLLSSEPSTHSALSKWWMLKWLSPAVCWAFGCKGLWHLAPP